MGLALLRWNPYPGRLHLARVCARLCRSSCLHIFQNNLTRRLLPSLRKRSREMERISHLAAVSRHAAGKKASCNCSLLMLAD